MPFASLVLLGMTLAQPTYPTPAEAGFHHCALIYGRETRDADDLALYATYQVDGQPRAWLFDSYLFLIFTTPSGRRTENGPTDMADWQYHLDTWFAPGRDLHALDEAIERASAVLGPPPAKRQIMLAIPWPDPAVTDFGDVDGDGRSEDLSQSADVDRVFDWYLTQMTQRFAAAGFRHLELWGGYWMNEGVRPIDQRNCRAAGEWLHANDLRFLWIPWYRAPGYDEWADLGFDLALLQPNYAFWEQHHGGRRRNRIQLAAELAQAAGMGIEIEMSGAPRQRPADLLWRHYLRDGAPDRGGYQAGATAYYLSTANVELLARSADLELRSLYDDLATYVAGGVIAEPERDLTWTDAAGTPLPLDRSGWGAPMDLARAETRFPATLTVADLTVYLDEPAGTQPWRGQARVEWLLPGETAWQPGSWALRGTASAADLHHQVLVLPVGRAIDGLRVSFESVDGALPRVTGLAPLERGPLPALDNLALGQPYTVDPPEEATYPDRGGQLNDGLISERGYSDGQAVGWHRGQIAVTFDLGAAQPVDEVRAHLQGGGQAAIIWPDDSLALLGADEPPSPVTAALADRGVPGAWALPQRVVVTHNLAPDAQLGYLAYRPAAPTPARWITLVFRTTAWLMLSEVEILSGGVNIAPTASYVIAPGPSPNPDTRYADDGQRLTSGVIATAYGRQTTGWQGQAPREITVDLGRARPVSEVTLWSLSGREAGITGLARVEIELSPDRVNWQPAGVALASTAPENLAGAEPYTLPLAATARYVRARVTAGNGWAMVSQIEVR